MPLQMGTATCSTSALVHFVELKSDVSRGPGSAKSRNYKLDLPPNADKFALANNVVKCD